VLVLTAPVVLRSALNGEMTVRPGQIAAGDQFVPFVAFVLVAKSLCWSLLMDRLTAW